MTNQAAIDVLRKALGEKEFVVTRVLNRLQKAQEEMSVDRQHLKDLQDEIASINQSIKVLEPEKVPCGGRTSSVGENYECSLGKGHKGSHEYKLVTGEKEREKCLIATRKKGMDWQCILDKGHTQGHDFRRYGVEPKPQPCVGKWVDHGNGKYYRCIRDLDHKGLCEYKPEGDDLKDDHL